MIALGCDHGGFELKQEIIAYLKARKIEYKDFGCYDNKSVDYPVYAKIVDFATKTPSNITGAFYYDARDAVGTALSNIIQTGADMDSELQTAQETVEFNMGN